MLKPTALVSFAHIVSRLLGWIYVACWSVSFYPQILLNWRRQCTRGLSIDYPTLNFLGFVSYTTSTAAFLFSATVKEQYAQRNPIAPETTVRFNDFVFALHAGIFTAITYSQFYPRLWGFPNKQRQRTNRAVVAVVWGSVLGIIAFAVFVASLEKGGGSNADRWAWIDVVYGFGYIKVLCTLLKYLPQAYLNYKLQSTAGWSIAAVLLDFAGSTFSLLQLIIDSALQADWSGLTGNPAKLGLSNIGLFMCTFYLWQHYVLYPQKSAKEDDKIVGDESSPLIQSVA